MCRQSMFLLLITRLVANNSLEFEWKQSDEQ